MKKDGKIFYGWWILLASIMIMTFLYAPIANLVSLFIKPVTEDLKMERADFMNYYTIMALASMVAAPLAGRLMKRIPIRIYLTTFTLFGAISYIGFSFSSTAWQFYLFAIPMGAALAGAAMIPVSVLITNWFVEKRGLALGIALAGTGLGGAILSPITSWLITDFGWRTAYLTIGIIIIVAIIPFTLFIVTLTPESKGLLPLGAKDIPTNENAHKPISGVSQKRTFLSLSFWCFCLAILVAGIVINGLIINMVPYLTDLGASPQHAALLLSLGSIMVIGGKLLIGKLYDSLGLFITITIICIGSFAALFFMMHGNLLIPGILFTIGMGIGGTAVTVTPAYLTGALFGEKDYGAKYGIVAIFTSLGAAITPIVSGAIYSINQSYDLLIYVLLGLTVAEIILFTVAIKTKPKADEELTVETITITNEGGI